MGLSSYAALLLLQPNEMSDGLPNWTMQALEMMQQQRFVTYLQLVSSVVSKGRGSQQSHSGEGGSSSLHQVHLQQQRHMGSSFQKHQEDATASTM